MLLILEICLAVIVVGVTIVTLIAYYSPGRLTTIHGDFRYGLAGFVVFAWWLSLAIFLLWSLTWPARKIIESGLRYRHYHD